MRVELQRGAEALGVTLSEEMCSQFELYWEILSDKNRVMNLTAVETASEAVSRHFLDSLALGALGPFHGKTLDIGSGAGFPGLPLKIAYPEMELTLLDSQKKRVDFLAELSGALSLEQVTCIHARAEEQALLPAFREDYDWVVSRAVARLNMLTELCLPFVRVGGRFLAMKAQEADEEIQEAESAVSALGGVMREILSYRCTPDSPQRKIVVIEKIAPTPDSYPRRFAKIQKLPL